MMRDLLRSLVLAGVVFLMMPTAAKAQTFSDVEENDWYYDDVMYLTESGVIGGYEDGTFRGNDALQVDAFIKMLVTALGYDLENGAGYWASTFIDQALELGLIEEDSFISYEELITRGEMAVMSAKALEMTESISPYSHYAYQIEDYAEIDEDQQTYVMIAVSQGIITGYEDFSFRPDGHATRAQAATVISRVTDVSRRKYTDVFEQKIAAMEEKSAAMVAYTASIFEDLEETANLFSDEEISIEGHEDTYKILNLLSGYMDDYMDDLESLEFQEAGIYEAGGIQWEVDGNSERMSYDGLIEGDLKVAIDTIEDVKQMVLTDVVTEVEFEMERHESGRLFYIEVRDPDKTTTIGYKVNLVEDVKYDILQEKDDDGEVLFFTYHRNGLTAYGDEVEGYVYKYVNDQAYEVEYVTDEISEIYSVSNGKQIYSDLVDGELNGNGYRKLADGRVYIGELIDGNLTGEGSLFFTNGIVLEGVFEKNVPTCRDCRFTGTDNDIATLDREMERVIAEVITEDMSKKEKITAIHDYLVLHIEYNSESVEDDLSDMNYNNAYTAIMDGSSVCLGYAQAMNLFMNRLGIDCYIVLGDVDQDGVNDHAWNYLLYGGEYVHVDVTWDDPDDGDKIRYDWFLKSDSSIRRERNIANILGWD